MEKGRKALLLQPRTGDSEKQDAVAERFMRSSVFVRMMLPATLPSSILAAVSWLRLLQPASSIGFKDTVEDFPQEKENPGADEGSGVSMEIMSAG